MDLFSYQYHKKNQSDQPLAIRMRPKHIDQLVGQQHIIGSGKLLKRMIEADRLSSMIFYGPPGTGKTTLAQLIANESKATFISLHAVTTSVKEVRQVTEAARERLHFNQERTILFIDEIHRFNRAQQDSLLKDIEEGSILFIGATTENPFVTINSALLSRVRLFELAPLTPIELQTILERAITDEEQGIGHLHVSLTDEAWEHILLHSGGDSRRALQTLELAALTTPADQEGKRLLNLEIIEDSMQQKAVRYDRAGDQHYDTISAFIKSMRGSDPDAALYYLAKMLKAGEDPLFIARRIVIQAAEDVGMADPRALLIATAAAQAVQFVGLPEAQIPMAEAVVYLATAPKSNSVYEGINKAMQTVAEENLGMVPHHLRDTHFKGKSEQAKKEEYQYPHNYPRAYVQQQYLPDEHIDKTFYHPSDHGYEQRIQQFLSWMRE
ncbi:putative ATPase [Seinonella peptonophila]|uniref:Putative ATPase n=1 Tax=Seinonella peptonophila TaxID=112248 RepID=A0A1M4WBC1_9BACL|nr:replication-associated recombination protein A [Seinonella peptonophila]SHE78262.1 putative ATPase [Seinonella peptonophila]